jgi:hypothetical protein
MKSETGKWGKSKTSKYQHYFDEGKIVSLCNLSKNPVIIGGDYPHCPICTQFLGIRNYLITNQSFGFKDKSMRLK